VSWKNFIEWEACISCNVPVTAVAGMV